MNKILHRLWVYYSNVVGKFVFLILAPVNGVLNVFYKSRKHFQKKLKVQRAELKNTVKNLKSLIKNFKKDLAYKRVWLIKELKGQLSNRWYAVKSRFGEDGGRRTERRNENRSVKTEKSPFSFLPSFHLSAFRPHTSNNHRSRPHRPRSIKAYKLISIISLTTALLITFANSSYAFYYYVLRDLPSPEKLTATSVPLTTRIYDRNNVLLYKIYGRQNRTWLPLNKIPQSVIDATISSEDKDFYNHHGLSLTGITRAAIAYVQGKPLQGGSTITQQLVKNVFLTPDRTWLRKIKEVVLTIETEQRYSKNKILEMYLNVVGFGGQAYGIEEAAQLYFGIPAGNLNTSQASLLAGLTASPTTFSPFGAHPELAKSSQEQVLQRMFTDGKITYDQMEEALNYPLTYAKQETTIKAPHFVMWVKEQLVERYGEEMVSSGGLEVHTTLDYNLQQQAEAEVDKQLSLLQFENVTNGAAMITGTKTGEVLAMVGSRDYFDTARDGNVNVCLMPRQPGSSIKVVTYSAALEDGFNANTILHDSPITYPQVGGPAYTPVNYDGQYHGNVTLRTALASSYNIPAVKTLTALGIPKVVSKGIAMGLNSWQNTDPGRFGLSLTLGGVEVTMTEMMSVYSTLGNGGQKVELQPFLEIKDGAGKTLEKADSDQTGQQIVKPAVAYIISKILSDNNARSPAFGTSSVLNIQGFDVAVKTGTTNLLRDNWTFGYTPNFVVGVWVGNNDNTPMSAVASGITGASPIMAEIMKNLVEDRPNVPFERPSDVAEVNICPQTGTLACEACPGYVEYFVKGNEPKFACNSEQYQRVVDELKKRQEERQQTH